MKSVPHIERVSVSAYHTHMPSIFLARERILVVPVFEDWKLPRQGPPEELSSLVPSLLELDLSDNLFSAWDEVVPLASAAPDLEVLNVSGNVLRLPVPAPADSTHVFRSLQVLVMNRCGVSFSQVRLHLSGISPS